MQTFDRYILGQIFPSLGMTLLVALMILLVERLLRVLDLVLGNSGPLHYVARMLAYLAPHYLGLALPFAFFLAILLTFNRLSRESEFDAFLAAGVGLHQLIRPLLLVTLVVLAIVAVTFNSLQPHARYAYRELVAAVKNPLIYAAAKEGVFVTQGDLTFLVEEISFDREAYQKVFIYENDSDGQTAVTTAKRGVLEKNTSGEASHALLYDGVRMAVPKDPSADQPSVLSFSEIRVSLGNDDLGPFRPRGRDEREFTLFELWNLIRNPVSGQDIRNYISEFNGRLVRLLSIVGLPFLAVSLALGRRRSTRFYGIAAGGGILILYNEFLQFGERLVNRGAEPGLALWLPLAVFLGLSGALFYRTAFVVGEPSATRAIEGAADRIVALFSRKRASGSEVR
ncbi:MAG: LptF/LptG family permease [Kiloniellales bacterium]|jgi:lipopolysaccharide export system permease protein|nr:LptF/LptG family permease [Kiloniellales bacterium]